LTIRERKYAKKSGDKTGPIDTQVCLLISNVIKATFGLLTPHVDKMTDQAICQYRIGKKPS
jgi:hypothetical protein